MPVDVSILFRTVDRLTNERDGFAFALARVTAERDAALAEVEAMRAVVEAARDASSYAGQLRLDDALDALRARKVGG